MRSLPPLDFLIVPPPDHDPANAENGPGSLRASPAAALKSSNPATAAALNEHNAWNCNAIRSAPCSLRRDHRTGRILTINVPNDPRQSLGHQFGERANWKCRRAPPHLSRLVVDKFTTDGDRTVVSQLSFLVARAIFAASGRRRTKKGTADFKVPAVRGKIRVSGWPPAVRD